MLYLHSLVLQHVNTSKMFSYSFGHGHGATGCWSLEARSAEHSSDIDTAWPHEVSDDIMQ